MTAIEDIKKVKLVLEPALLKVPSSKKSNPEYISKLIEFFKKRVEEENFNNVQKRSVLFILRDNHFLDFKETQDLWLDLAELWGVEKHLPHLVNKTKL